MKYLRVLNGEDHTEFVVTRNLHHNLVDVIRKREEEELGFGGTHRNRNLSVHPESEKETTKLHSKPLALVCLQSSSYVTDVNND